MFNSLLCSVLEPGVMIGNVIHRRAIVTWWCQHGPGSGISAPASGLVPHVGSSTAHAQIWLLDHAYKEGTTSSSL